MSELQPNPGYEAQSALEDAREPLSLTQAAARIAAKHNRAGSRDRRRRDMPRLRAPGDDGFRLFRVY
jgi:hypothetical protein